MRWVVSPFLPIKMKQLPNQWLQRTRSFRRIHAHLGSQVGRSVDCCPSGEVSSRRLAGWLAGGLFATVCGLNPPSRRKRSLLNNLMAKARRSTEGMETFSARSHVKSTDIIFAFKFNKVVDRSSAPFTCTIWVCYSICATVRCERD